MLGSGEVNSMLTCTPLPFTNAIKQALTFSWQTSPHEPVFQCGASPTSPFSSMSVSSYFLTTIRSPDESAQRMVSSKSLTDLISAYIGPPTKARAVRGNIVTVDGGEGEAGGVCMGSKVYALGATGMRELDRKHIRSVWAR